jgi:hypothetical protein
MQRLGNGIYKIRTNERFESDALLFRQAPG